MPELRWLTPALWGALVLNVAFCVGAIATGRPFFAANLAGVVIVAFALWIRQHPEVFRGE